MQLIDDLLIIFAVAPFKSGVFSPTLSSLQLLTVAIDLHSTLDFYNFSDSNFQIKLLILVEKKSIITSKD